jgi:hypothetical protein
MEESVGAFCSFGGSSKDQVELAVNRAKDSLTRDEKLLPARAGNNPYQKQSPQAKAVY